MSTSIALSYDPDTWTLRIYEGNRVRRVGFVSPKTKEDLASLLLAGKREVFEAWIKRLEHF